MINMKFWSLIHMFIFYTMFYKILPKSKNQKLKYKVSAKSKVRVKLTFEILAITWIMQAWIDGDAADTNWTMLGQNLALINQNLKPLFCAQIIFFLLLILLDARSAPSLVIVGRDTRVSSPSLASACLTGDHLVLIAGQARTLGPAQPIRSQLRPGWPIRGQC